MLRKSLYLFSKLPKSTTKSLPQSAMHSFMSTILSRRSGFTIPRRYLSSKPNPEGDDKDSKDNKDEKNKKDDKKEDKEEEKVIEPTDLQLQEHFDSLPGRCAIMIQALLFDPASNEAWDLYRKLITKGRTHGFISSVILLADLLNPLLRKYEFDLDDFVEGVKIAFQSVKQASYLFVDSSVYPEKYINRDKELEECRELLLDTVGDRLWKELHISAKEKKLFREMNITFQTAEREQLQIVAIAISRVQTRIVAPADAEDDILSSGGAGVVQASESKETVHPLVEKREVDAAKRAEDLRRYQPGSVVASIDVFIEANERLLPPLEPKAGEKAKKSKQVVRLTELWTFEGCISGQTPLQWIVAETTTQRFNASL